jgi:hypothetical protein
LEIGKIQALVDDAVSKGAKLECGGRAYIHPIHTKVNDKYQDVI